MRDFFLPIPCLNTFGVSMIKRIIEIRDVSLHYQIHIYEGQDIARLQTETSKNWQPLKTVINKRGTEHKHTSVKFAQSEQSFCFIIPKNWQKKIY